MNMIDADLNFSCEGFFGGEVVVHLWIASWKDSVC